MAANETLTTLVYDAASEELTYTDEDGAATVIDMAGIVKANETVTTMVNNGDATYDYTSEDNTVTTIDIAGDVLTELQDNTSDIFNEVSDIVDTAETLTSLVDNGNGTVTYTDEDGTANIITVGGTETITTLSQDDSTGDITYVNEDAVSSIVDVVSVDADNLVQVGTDGGAYIDGTTIAEPWFDQANVGNPATLNTQDIYQMGRVGIGTDDMLGTANTNVVLAINGSMLTTSSIYADYVFEGYFDGVSKLKADYAFKSLEEVETFINENRHLPGITKIDALAKNEDGDYVINPSELSVQVLEKVEELYLHTIEQQKQLKAKDQKIKELETRLERLEKLLLNKSVD